jgi:hypothetical protein
MTFRADLRLSSLQGALQMLAKADAGDPLGWPSGILIFRIPAQLCTGLPRP